MKIVNNGNRESVQNMGAILLMLSEKKKRKKKKERKRAINELYMLRNRELQQKCI
jgi:hypothetical protein